MSDASTKRMLDAYIEQSAQKPGFFTQFFSSPQKNFHNSEKVQLDIKRAGHRIAPVLVSLGSDLHRTENREYVNKEFTPTIYGEEFSLGVFDAMKRPMGQDPFQDVNYLKSLQDGLFDEMAEREAMIRRGIELQASQVLRTGTLSLPGTTGATAFTLDYAPKNTHSLVAAETDWDENNVTTRVKDIRGLCNAIWQDGNTQPKYLVMGELAFLSWIADAEVQAQIRKDGTMIGEQVPPQLREGGVYHGRVSVGMFQLEMWTAPGFYQAENGTPTKYLGNWEVLVISENARLDLTFGNIPVIPSQDTRVQALSIGRVSSSAGRIDLITNVWLGRNNVYGSCQARPLCIPTQIDSFASLNAKAT